MNTLQLHGKILKQYQDYIESFINIKDDDIKTVVKDAIAKGKLWKEPLIQFNPAFDTSESIGDLIKQGVIHPTLKHVFKDFNLFAHQVKALRLGSQDKDFVVTSGTGSGKSLTFIGTIFNYLASNPDLKKGVKAVIVYPMNALINSQSNELKGYRDFFEKKTGQSFPFSFGQYTGQEKEEERRRILEELPDIILTNFSMLELVLTRSRETVLKQSIYENLKFLAFDELHTFRGRQGSDVGILIRRIKSQAKNAVRCIGTSATMVSGGTLKQQREIIAHVATTFFGSSFKEDQVVSESIIRSLNKADIKAEQLKESLKIAPANVDEEFIRSNSLIQWLEQKIALTEKEGILIRNRPSTLDQISKLLSDDGQIDKDVAFTAINKALDWISIYNSTKGSLAKPILPFKIHQFISQTGSVYISLDDKKNRIITLDPGALVTVESMKKPIFPIVFSRESGAEFLCVTKSATERKLLPREFNDWASTEDEQTDGSERGYLLTDISVWNPSIEMENLPEAWIKRNSSGQITGFEKKWAKRAPQQIWYDEFGNFSDEPSTSKKEGWFMPYKLLFDPTSGSFYDTKTNEGTKLTKLGSEGRSTATTTLTFAILKELAAGKFPDEKQKVLSFTDNRQDAALQSGHFNDFIDTVRLRSAIYQAVNKSSVLEFHQIGTEVFEALGLDQASFAASPAEFQGPKRDNEKVFKDFLTYQVLEDLKRSWRVVLPNLEQCGLLKIRYKYLEEDAAENSNWSDTILLRDLSPDERFDFIQQVLDFFRKQLAIRCEDYLTSQKIENNLTQINQKLKDPYRYQANQRPTEAGYVRLVTLPRSFKYFSVSAGNNSGIGKYIKRVYKEVYPSHSLKGEEYKTHVIAILDKLGKAGYLNREQTFDENRNETFVYQLNVDYLLWVKGDGESVDIDKIKNPSYKDDEKKGNSFFKTVYETDFRNLKKYVASDHTGQISNAEERQLREQLFREGKISALYCSPTMELGVDISTLDVVHMRNVPPNPANYAQRSGRAGRSGQSALVFTYCGSYAAHDKNYFRNSIDMVSGNVAPPRLDLQNQDLLRSHLYALILSEITIEELNDSIFHLFDSTRPDLPLKLEIELKLKLPDGVKSKAKRIFNSMIKDFDGSLKEKYWFTDSWIEAEINRFGESFTEALRRWKTLYNAALTMRSLATQRIESGTYTALSKEFREAQRMQRHATVQIDLLKCETAGRTSSLSEFYPYRYLASEGFLPGYNFTRLPIRTFLQNEVGEYVSRARFVALREFGPRNIIYHSSQKYSITQMIKADVETDLRKAKVSKKSGYFLEGAEFDQEQCPFSKEMLSNDSTRKIYAHLLELSETRAEVRDRISCDEEERTSQGFDIETFFSVPAGLTTIRKAILKNDADQLLNIQYIPTAKLIQVNNKWRNTKQQGFRIGKTSGFWKPMTDEPNPEAEPTLDVQLYTWDTADALYIQPIKSLKLNHSGVVTLQYALKRAIELIYQIEPSELGVTLMGDSDNPNIFVYEAAQGSLGILSQIVEEKGAFQNIVKKAIEICRYTDTEYKNPASYEDLLSYYNQRHHQEIDRFLIQDALNMMLTAEMQYGLKNHQIDYDSVYESMLNQYDKTSSTERKFLEYLYRNNLRLPDSAQERTDGIYSQPDFFYEPDVWVFCDGTSHDRPEVKAQDVKIREAILNRGQQVFVYYYRDDLATKVAERPDIFKKIK